jgi:hypothetical protein
MVADGVRRRHLGPGWMPSWRKPPMSSRQAQAHDDAVVLGDQVLDHEAQVREAAAQKLDGMAESVAAPRCPRRCLVIEVVGVDELVDGREIAGIEHCCVESRDEVLVGGRHAAPPVRMAKTLATVRL